MSRLGITPFQYIYDRFLNKITDDMYLEITEEETRADLKNILISALPYFIKPKFAVYNYNLEKEEFNLSLTNEEIEIISELMVLVWLKRQIANVDIIKMKYSTKDFQLTSQANHLKVLLELQKQLEENCNKLQRLYLRRELTEEGLYSPKIPALGGRDYEE